jgi:enolase
MAIITEIKAREILASGGAPSLEVSVKLDDGSLGEASVSYGASAGSKEAFVLLDEDPSRYRGKGMLKAVSNVNEKIAPLLIGKESSDQRGLDKLMIEADGTENKQNFGANAILGVSMAIARASKISFISYISVGKILVAPNLVTCTSGFFSTLKLDCLVTLLPQAVTRTSIPYSP